MPEVLWLGRGGLGIHTGTLPHPPMSKRGDIYGETRTHSRRGNVWGWGHPFHPQEPRMQITNRIFRNHCL